MGRRSNYKNIIRNSLLLLYTEALVSDTVEIVKIILSKVPGAVLLGNLTVPSITLESSPNIYHAHTIVRPCHLPTGL